MAQQRRAQVAHAHQKRLVHVVPAQECFDGLDEFGDRVAGLGLAHDACVLQVLSHLDWTRFRSRPIALQETWLTPWTSAPPGNGGTEAALSGLAEESNASWLAGKVIR